MSKRGSSRKPTPRRRLVVRLAGAAGAGLIAHPVPVLAIVGGAAAFGAVYANVALLQPGKHPAPLFTTRPNLSAAGAVASLPSAASNATDGSAPSGERPALVRDIQAALADRGYEVGSATGALDAATITAIRAFETAQGLPQTGEPSEALLARVLIAAPQTADGGKTADGGRSDVKRVQRALADLGYGPLKIDGRLGGQTASAIRRFRTDHGLPAGDSIDPKLVQTLIAIGGMPKA